jgi:hypothetical protein
MIETISLRAIIFGRIAASFVLKTAADHTFALRVADKLPTLFKETLLNP